LLIQKSILKDATNELSLHFLAKKGIMVVQDVERNDVEFISKTIGAVPIAHIDNMTPEKFGFAELCEEVRLGDDSKIFKITGVKNNKTVSVLTRGSNHLVLDEADRSLHDALCVLRSLVKSRALMAGGGAP
jgi:T-complex protein 1 subunit delta